MTTKLPVATKVDVGGIVAGDDLVVDDNGVAATLYNGRLTLNPQKTAVGDGSEASAANAVALGNQSVADEENVVSFGNDGLTRRLIHVAEGIADSDAVSFGQLGGKLNSAGGTMTGGLKFDTGVVDDPTDLDKHITLASGTGLSASAGSLNYVVPAGSKGHRFYVGEVLVAQFPPQEGHAFVSLAEHLGVLSDLRRQIDDLQRRVLSLEGG